AVTACATSSGRVQTAVVFSQYSPLSRSAEVARRTVPPLARHAMERELAASHRTLAEQAIDLASEKFDLFVPSSPPPPAGYGLVVYIAPSSGPFQIGDWDGPLDSHRLILVSAQRSGNEARVLDRRVPLALLAYENVRARFPIDSQRVYVMGFSGGARVAEIVALAYPDVFQGAVLNAGSDPIDGKDGDHKPPAELFRAFQRSRLVFVTGDQDADHLRQEDRSRDSLRDNCVLNVESQVALRRGHQAIDAFALDHALEALDARPPVDADELARCNARLQAAVAAELTRAEAAIARGEREAARAQLEAIDARFGGLAEPRILELADRLTPPR
ncbi:MAG TPA: PHB depolymerase family esterase, partial [Kofleriaceae bacterium]|nr:PHB depolymerase family esterase [Kofleriaceae bacterium]